MTAALFLGLLAACITVSGWFLVHDQNRQLQLRKDRLELLSRQLSSFYGPLHISCEASKIAYRRLLDKLGRDERIDEKELTPQEIEEWVNWMNHVFLPLNEHREEIIKKHSDLIIENAVPECIVEYMAHVATYRVIAANWQNKKLARNKFAHIEFPEALDAYAQVSFSKLKEEQTALISELRVTGPVARQGPVQAVKRFFSQIG